MAAADPHASFEVLDAFGGLAQLVRRSPTLDGSVALRATQGCSPLLEGNEFGLQVCVTRPLRAERSLGRWRAITDEALVASERVRRAALPMLRARGVLGHDAWLELERGVLIGARSRVRLWTGLCVRPRPGTWLLVSSVANRRNRGFTIASRVIPTPDAWTPLMLELEPVPGVRDLLIQGEVACISVVEPNLALARHPLAERPELGRAHFDFYEQSYFAAKRRGEITRRYRKTIDAAAIEPAPGVGEIVELGPCTSTIEPLTDCLLPKGPASSIPAGLGELPRLGFANLIDFTIAWDGHNVAIDHDRATLEQLAGRLEANFVAALGRELVDAHSGAMWYLSKYFTPHPAGEPHFFVKPWALTRLPSGWSAMIDGVHGSGYDVMRGVVHLDQFFATPAVFQLFEPLRALRVPAGRTLMHVTPIPRTRLSPTAITTTLEGAPWS